MVHFLSCYIYFVNSQRLHYPLIIQTSQNYKEQSKNVQILTLYYPLTFPDTARYLYLKINFTFEIFVILVSNFKGIEGIDD